MLDAVRVGLRVDWLRAPGAVPDSVTWIVEAAWKAFASASWSRMSSSPTRSCSVASEAGGSYANAWTEIDTPAAASTARVMRFMVRSFPRRSTFRPRRAGP